MQKLLIADRNEDFRLALAEALQGHYHIRSCSSGREALDLLRSDSPDIFVLDLMLPELDGITLLETAVSEGIRPKVLAATSLLSDYVLEAAARLGIGYLILKPCDVHATAARIGDLTHTLRASPRKPEKRTLVSQQLLSLSLSTKHKGYNYLIEAVLMMEKEPNVSITKELYPAVAKICGCERGHVERSIRSAIESAWKRRDPLLWQQYFPDAVSRPSNAVFICRLAEALRLDVE